MKKFLVLASLTLGLNSYASNLVCHFTEPFMVLNINTQADKEIKVLDEGNINLDTKNISLLVVSSKSNDSVSEIDLLTSENSVINLRLDSSIEGNDGMSDKVYPMEGILTIDGNKNFGGCELK